jgi:hypothetical protein
VLRQRHPNEDEALTDDDRVVVDQRAPVQDGHAVVDPASSDDRQQVRADPVPIGTDTTWARPWSDASPTAVPVAAPPVTSRRTVTWGQVLIVLAGLASLVFGFGAVALGGLAGSVTAPIVQVFTYDHTPLLGLIEIGAGVVLVLGALIRGGRWIAGPVGVAAIVGGALIVAELEWTQTKLAAEQRFGWVAIAIGSVAYVGAMVPTKKRVVATRAGAAAATSRSAVP